MGILPLIFLVSGIVAAIIILAALEQGWRPNIEEEKEALGRAVLQGNVVIKIVFLGPLVILHVVLERVIGLDKITALIIALCLYIPLMGVIWYLFRKSRKGKINKHGQEVIFKTKDKPPE